MSEPFVEPFDDNAVQLRALTQRDAHRVAARQLLTSLDSESNFKFYRNVANRPSQ